MRRLLDAYNTRNAFHEKMINFHRARKLKRMTFYRFERTSKEKNGKKLRRTKFTLRRSWNVKAFYLASFTIFLCYCFSLQWRIVSHFSFVTMNEWKLHFQNMQRKLCKCLYGCENEKEFEWMRRHTTWHFGIWNSFFALVLFKYECSISCRPYFGIVKFSLCEHRNYSYVFFSFFILNTFLCTSFVRCSLFSHHTNDRRCRRLSSWKENCTKIQFSFVCKALFLSSMCFLRIVLHGPSTSAQLLQTRNLFKKKKTSPENENTKNALSSF